MTIGIWLTGPLPLQAAGLAALPGTQVGHVTLPRIFHVKQLGYLQWLELACSTVKKKPCLAVTQTYLVSFLDLRLQWCDFPFILEYAGRMKVVASQVCLWVKPSDLYLLGESTVALDTGWGTDSAGAWGPSAHLEAPSAPTHFTNTEQPYVEHVTTTALPHGSELTGQHKSPQSFWHDLLT